MRTNSRIPTHIITVTCSIALILLASLSGPGPVQAETSTEAYEKEIEDWHRGRIERLKQKDGYFSLAGLFPLAEGENSFGSAQDNDLVFPGKTAATAGVFVLEDGAVAIEVAENVMITAAGEPVRSASMRTDREKETTVLEMGSYRFYVIDRGGRMYVRLKDLDSELIDQFEGIDRFPVDIAWRIEGRFEPYDPPKPLRIPTELGYEIELLCPGAVVFAVHGETYRLEPTPSGDQLFFVFGDETSGLETYGGGRFLYTDGPSEEGRVVLDFNKAYNPPCVFSPYATCPLPHAANRLPVRIEAGEKTYGKDQ